MSEEIKIKLLVVDDDNCCTSIFKAYLDYKETWEIVTSNSPKEAIALLKEDKDINVIVSDLKMPEMNGLVFLSQVSMIRPDSMRVLFSGDKVSNDTPSYVDLQYQKGAFSMPELVEKVNKKLRG